MALSVHQITSKKNQELLQNNWKPIIAIGAGISILVIGYGVYKRIAPPPEPTPGGLEENTNLPPATITPAQAAIKADALQKAMGTFGMANEEELKTIRKTLQELNYNDFILVNKAFGERRYVAVTGISQVWPAPLKSLNYWLSEELEPADLNALKQVIPNAF